MGNSASGYTPIDGNRDTKVTKREVFSISSSCPSGFEKLVQGAWIRLGHRVILFCLIALWGVLSPVLSREAIGVFVLGDMIPDQAFLHYDPALSYSLVPYPSFSLAMFEDQAEAMARHIRMYLPRGEEGKFWETFAARWQFVIDLPYLASYPLQGSAYEEAKLHLLRYVSGAVVNCQVSILTSPTWPSSMMKFAVPYRGPLIQSCPDCPLVNDVPFDLLGGSPSKDFTLKIANSTIFQQFEGTGIEHYHDATLVLLARPLSAATIPITIDLSGEAKARLEIALSRDPGALRDGKVPWLIYCNVSKTQEFEGPVMQQVFGNAGGIAWTCASPLNGPFFFPRGGYIASSPAYNPRDPPTISQISLSEEHPYAWDIVSTMIYYSCGRDIPDLLAVHETRTKFAEYWTRYVDILHVLDWVEVWRQTPVVNLVWRDLEQVEKKKADATSLYIDGRYDQSDQTIQQALDRIAEAERHAQMSLTEALAWVYIIEGCAVSSTALIAGSITLYFVGARRTTQVGETRLRPAGEC